MSYFRGFIFDCERLDCTHRYSSWRKKDLISENLVTQDSVKNATWTPTSKEFTKGLSQINVQFVMPHFWTIKDWVTTYFLFMKGRSFINDHFVGMCFHIEVVWPSISKRPMKTRDHINLMYVNWPYTYVCLFKPPVPSSWREKAIYIYRDQI